MASRPQLFAAIAIIVGIGSAVLGCYAFFTTAAAVSLLKDLTGLKVSDSMESDVQQFTQRHVRYLVSQDHSESVATSEFRVDNRWLAALRLEPPALFRVVVKLKDKRVYHISASLQRAMDIFPTFKESAGMVDEYSEFPQNLSQGGHYEFPTPIGKPYLHVQLDSHASGIQRQRAYDFSFYCLIKPGGGCDLPCDYLPSAWQDWKTQVRNAGLLDLFNQHYPNSSRCMSNRP